MYHSVRSMSHLLDIYKSNYLPIAHHATSNYYIFFLLPAVINCSGKGSKKKFILISDINLKSTFFTGSDH